MTPRALPLLLALGCAACVSETAVDPERGWSLSADEPVTVVGGEAQVAAKQAAASQAVAQAAADQQGQDAAQAGKDHPDLLELIEPAKPEDVEADYLQEDASPFHRLGRNVIRGIDGSWSKMYTLKSDRSAGVLQMLQAEVPGFPPPTLAPSLNDPTKQTVLNEGSSETGIRWVLHPDFYTDPTGTLGEREALVNPKIADLLVITGPPATLLFIDQLLDQLLADLPQVELQVRIVEVNLDDLIDWDSKIAILHLPHIANFDDFDPLRLD